jgi:hypothetical protein
MENTEFRVSMGMKLHKCENMLISSKAKKKAFVIFIENGF